MRIAIDASRTTIAVRTGTENYALQLIRALLALHTPHSITLYFRDQPHQELFETYPNVRYKVFPFTRLWTHVRFAAALWADRPDVTFVPAHTLPILFPGRAVATVHDLGYRFFPQAHPGFERYYLDFTTRYSARRATRILADSQATRGDLMAQYHIAADKIDVVYPGVEGLRRADDTNVALTRQKYHLPERYFLFLGTLQPRKNIGRLIAAFARYCDLHPESSESLVLAGKRGWLIEPILESALATLPEVQRARIVFTGYVGDNDVASLYSGATALLLPSLYEGFGFPVLEAMQCGTPVLCSDTSSLPELAGDAAVLVDPLSVESISDGMVRIVTDTTLRTILISKGYEQASRFTWSRAAAATMAVLENAAN